MSLTNSSIPSQAEIRRHLQTEIVGQWIPRAIDPTGGFYQNFDATWQPLLDESRGVVYQARVTWLASIGGNQAVAEHGVRFLMEHLWDKKVGGFWWSVGLDGKPAEEKHTYGNAFALYALARHANFTRRSEDKARAMIAFSWLDRNAYDPKLRGWFETLNGANQPILISDPGSADAIGTPYGVRSMNTTIHILEALIELFALFPDPVVKQRLELAFSIVRDRFVTPKGELHYYLSADYASSRSDIDSFGHELETAYLLLEAAEMLGKPDDQKTWQKAKRLVDHCLKTAWDDKNGGFFYEGHIGKGPSERKKEWWTTAEGLNALRIFAKKFGGVYQTRYEQLWKFVLEHQVDKTDGGWYPTIDEHNNPVFRNKSDAWTEGYHQGRAIFLASGADMYSRHK